MNEPDQDESILERICIAMPCSIDWESMQGTDEARLCGGCNKNVYDISAMSKRRAEEILSAPQLPCIRINRALDSRRMSELVEAREKRLEKIFGNCHFSFDVIFHWFAKQGGEPASGNTQKDGTAKKEPLYANACRHSYRD